MAHRVNPALCRFSGVVAKGAVLLAASARIRLQDVFALGHLTDPEKGLYEFSLAAGGHSRESFEPLPVGTTGSVSSHSANN